MPEPRHCADWITSYLEYNYNTEPPVSYHKWCAISAIAAALQRKCWTIWEGPTYPNFYIVLVGPPGKCRKGTAMHPTVNLLRRLQVPLSANRTTSEALIEKIFKSLQQHSPIGDPNNIVLHCSLSVISPELTVFLDPRDDRMMAGILDWYDCADLWSYDTKHQGSPQIENLYINLLGASTPALIATALPQTAIGSGILSRIIFVYADRAGKRVTFPIKTEQERLLYEDLYHDLELINMLCGQFKFTEDYLERWNTFYADDHDNPPMLCPQLFDYLSRRATHVRKLAMVISASQRDSMIITGADLDRAITELSAVERRMSGVFVSFGKLRDAAEVSRLIGRIASLGPEGTISKWELYNEFKLDMEPIRFDATIKYLETSKQISILISGSNTTITNLCARKPGQAND